MLVLAIVLGTPVVLLLAAVTYTQLTGEAKLRRQLRRARLYKIAELSDGQTGRIVGAAQPHRDDVLTAPLSGRTCVYFIARLEERYYDGHNHLWREKVREERGVPFVVTDDSGRALVDPTGARVSLETDEMSRSGEISDDVPEPREEAFLARHQVKHVASTKLRYFEAVIAVDERVAVVGAGVREPDPDVPPSAAYRGDAPTRLHMTSSSKVPLLISDYASTLLTNA